MTATTLTNNKNKTTTHTGTSGFTVTAIREGNGLDVLMEFDQATLGKTTLREDDNASTFTHTATTV